MGTTGMTDSEENTYFSSTACNYTATKLRFKTKSKLKKT